MQSVISVPSSSASTSEETRAQSNGILDSRILGNDVAATRAVHSNKPSYILLGIESSCDDTAVAIVSSSKEIISDIVVSQFSEHAPYQGVVPEIAARSHMHNLEQAVTRAFAEARLTIDDIDAIAVTGGPGLIGGVIVGTMFAKGLASASKKPFIAINHLEGHILTPRLTNDVAFPYLALLVSGGHCQFIAVLGLGNYQLLGETLDDAVGEAFDKTAKMLGLGYPGGPIIEKMAKLGDPHTYKLPLSMVERVGCDMSFSGLKTAVRKVISEKEISDQFTWDICASFQYTVAEILAARSINAIKMFEDCCLKHGVGVPNSKQFILSGGVAANMFLRSRLEIAIAGQGFSLIAPPLKLCTDNGAMIAWAGVERFALGLVDSTSFCPRAKWSLADLSVNARG